MLKYLYQQEGGFQLYSNSSWRIPLVSNDVSYIRLFFDNCYVLVLDL